MRFLLHGTLTPAVTDALQRHGHQVSSQAHADIHHDDKVDLLKGAHKQQLDIVTSDASLVDAVFGHRIAFGRSIVYLQLEGGDLEQDDAIDRLFKRYKRLSPGRLYTVTATRVKIRQLPSA